jgi:broad specificity phosphatase PhoE
MESSRPLTAPLTVRTATTARRLLLVRHGQTDAVGRILCGRAPGIHLNATGVSEPSAAAAQLSHAGVVAEWSSPRLDAWNCVDAATASVTEVAIDPTRR